MPFNPNDIGQPNGNYFALPCSLREATLALISVPWDVTASFRPGTCRAPEAILAASAQVDLFDADVPEAWNMKIGTVPQERQLTRNNKKYRALAEKVITALSRGAAPETVTGTLEKVNAACEAMNDYVYRETQAQLAANRIPAIIGGEHSVPLGALRALSGRYAGFGILHIDAHADLREAYEGFTCSHASIMHNALRLNSVKRLVQVAVRDYCNDEAECMQRDKRITVFSDALLHEAAFKGKTWAAQTAEIIRPLPQQVYISFDIDGLSPDHCPNTGTPVPGGLSYARAVYLLRQLALSGRRIIGFDLCETAPDANDASTACRLLFQLCCCAHLASRKMKQTIKKL
ncbi:MAG: agmatinase family protein [Prevotellaceae bacterium]|jgi:agmatinase|nr:agmatinase family protein [Prevotellaceae bacterium]